MKKELSARRITKVEDDATSNLPVYVHRKVTKRRSLVEAPTYPRLKSFWRLNSSFDSVDERKDEAQDEPEKVHRDHYRIKSIRSSHRGFWDTIRHFAGCSRDTPGFLSYENWIGVPGNCDINHAITQYLSWCFKTSLSILFLSLLCVFFILILTFSFLMIIVGEANPECFDPVFGAEGTPFSDAYALSWTTFTTVGYGNTFPEHGKGSEDSNGDYSEEHGYKICFWLQFLCSLEAFVGVVFASICGALIFSKVLRIQSLAPVLFSDPIIVRYGRGVQKAFRQDLPPGKIPCPVLSFRIANVYSDRQGGELIDAKIQLKAIFTSRSECDDFDSEESSDSEHMVMDENPNNCEGDDDDDQLTVALSGEASVRIEEDPGSNFDVQRTFSKIEVDAHENPFFKRIWTVNHILDQNSPLVVPHVRRRILENEGYWPPYLNDAESVRASVQFSQIFVNVSAISIVSANEVYAQHMYHYFDMNVGFDFAPVLTRSSKHRLQIRYDMLGDVVVQKGGGNESFLSDDEEEAENGVLRNFSGHLQVLKVVDE